MAAKKKKRRHFTPEYKAEVVELLRKSGNSSWSAHAFGVFSTWGAPADATPSGSIPSSTPPASPPAGRAWVAYTTPRTRRLAVPHAASSVPRLGSDRGELEG